MSVGSIRIYLKIPEAFAFLQGKKCSSGNLEQNAFMQTTSVNDFQILHAKWFLNEVIKTNWNLNGEISYYHIQFKRICARYAVNGVWAYFDAGMWMRVRVLVWRRHVIMKWRRKQESHFFNFRHHDYFTSVFILFHRFFFLLHFMQIQSRSKSLYAWVLRVYLYGACIDCWRCVMQCDEHNFLYFI